MTVLFRIDSSKLFAFICLVIAISTQFTSGDYYFCSIWKAKKKNDDDKNGRMIRAVSVSFKAGSNIRYKLANHQVTVW